jgi:hypothetical protein
VSTKRDAESVDEDYRVAVRGLTETPVRWKRVAALTRRRRLLALLGLLTVGVAITVVLATGLLASKKALDPSFQLPFISSATATVEFGQPDVAGGHTPLSRYLRAADLQRAAFSDEALREEGWVFKSAVMLNGYRGRRIAVEWELSKVGATDEITVSSHPDVTSIDPPSSSHRQSVQVWLASPAESGRYSVSLRLEDEEGNPVSQQQSRPFIVLARDFFVPYSTETYRTRLPADWELHEDYESRPPERRVSTASGPNDLSILVDTTLNWNGDSSQSARTLERWASDDPTYRRVKFQWARLGPSRVFEWTFQQGDRAKTDILFTRGKHGYGILAEGPRRRLREVRAVAREISRALRPR